MKLKKARRGIFCHHCIFFLMGDFVQDVFYGDCLFHGRIENSDKVYCNSVIPYSHLADTTMDGENEQTRKHLLSLIDSMIEARYRGRRAAEERELNRMADILKCEYLEPERITSADEWMMEGGVKKENLLNPIIYTLECLSLTMERGREVECKDCSRYAACGEAMRNFF